MERRLALIGCGYWGKNLARNFHALGVLRTLCDSNPLILADQRERYPDVTMAECVDEVFQDKDVHAIAIAVPAADHYRLARRALESGKHVFIEKPLALTYSDGAILCELAESNRRTLMVGHLLRYHPAVQQLKVLIDRGELGRIRYTYANRLNIGKIRREENSLWSFAPHDISVITALLGGLPREVQCQGEAYLHHNVADVTLSILKFADGIQAHIFVSWLHPFKEQTLVIVGDKKMAVFDDLSADSKLVLYPHRIEWQGGRVPVAMKAEREVVPLTQLEPLTEECKEFIASINEGRKPRTDGQEGLRVLRVLDACQRSLEKGGAAVALQTPGSNHYSAHPTAVVDEGCEIGEGTQIWHFSHVMKGARIGSRCRIGQNVFVASDVVIGNNVKIQNNVSIYQGCILEDDVFCGPSCVFTNVSIPRSHVERRGQYERTVAKRGATIGANATVVCGRTIGEYAFVGAGAVVTRDVPNYALILGNPGRIAGWRCSCGSSLVFPEDVANGKCQECGARYARTGGIVHPAH